MPNSFTYPAYFSTQTESSKPLLLFTAPSVDIEQWAGVPQRGRIDEGETVGFQRQENAARLRELAGFFDEGKNVVQNPLLAALQDEASVTFTPIEEGSSFGQLEIVTEDYSRMTLRTLIKGVISRLDARVPALKSQPIDVEKRQRLIDRASQVHALESDLSQQENSDSEETDLILDADEPIEDDSDVGFVLLTEETQLVDFYQELVIRAEILDLLGDDEDPDELLGFKKDAMIGYLQPTVLVDGQHRLKGAVMSAKRAAESDENRATIRQAIDSGVDASEASQAALMQHARKLPVSLLLDDAPSEHVFQFVVVNQKATPMSAALLGTIVSTSLSRDELAPVTQRLTAAGIRLEDSQAVAYLTRSPESPFRNLVQTGIAGDDSGLLPWSVLNRLTSIFRELKGGKLFGQTNDYAAIWRKRWFSASDLVAGADEEREKFALWSETDGPWRPVFVKFFQLVRDKFGSDDPAAHNFWGNTGSNLYNKISLTILAADFFQYLTERRITIDSVEHVETIFNEWLEGVGDQYFAREWRMGGLKKDQAPVQKKWAEVWTEYRKNPERLPRVDSYKP